MGDRTKNLAIWLDEVADQMAGSLWLLLNLIYQDGRMEMISTIEILPK